MDKNATVLVTGASGFVAMHCVVQLLGAGYTVKGTVRSKERGEQTKAHLSRHVDAKRFSFAIANLADDNGWKEAMSGCRYVLHTASPVPRSIPRNAAEVIEPARDGTLRVLKAAVSEGVQRVVMTSSTAAILWGHARDGSRTYTEADWTVLNKDVGPYEQSKTIAERAAWEFANNQSAQHKLELVTINPGLILGPLLTDEYSISGEVVYKVISAELPGIPNLFFSPVDVRDVAQAHLAAMNNPDAANQRFVVGLGNTSWQEIAEILANHYRAKGYKITTKTLPNWLLRCASLFDKTIRITVPELGKRQDVSDEHARMVLGWQARDLKTTVIDMAESMIKRGLVHREKFKM